MSYKLLKQAADQLDALATELEATQKKVASAEVVKTAAADDQKTGRLALAKVAADKLFSVGLISSAEKRDQFAAEITDPAVALQKLAKLADHVAVPSLGTVVLDKHIKEASSEDVWALHVQSTLSRLNIK